MVMVWWLVILLGSMVLMSGLSLALYAWDKRKAIKGGWRIPEKRLHLVALLGGWPGAMIGQKWLRHKTIKRSFRLVFWGTVALHILAGAAITYAVWLEMSARQ